MKEIFVIFFLITGAVFILIASIGLLKMPDVYLRMSASTIAATFGVALMLVAAAIHFMTLGIIFHIIGVIIFLILTVPVGAHLMGRASHIIGLPMWDKTLRDDMKGKYNKKTHQFSGMNEKSEARSGKSEVRSEKFE